MWQKLKQQQQLDHCTLDHGKLMETHLVAHHVLDWQETRWLHPHATMLHAQQKAGLGSIITVHEPQLQCLQKFLIVLAGCFLKTCITRWSCQQKCHDCSQPCCITIHLLLELSFLPQGQNKIDCHELGCFCHKFGTVKLSTMHESIIIAIAAAEAALWASQAFGGVTPNAKGENFFQGPPCRSDNKVSPNGEMQTIFASNWWTK